MRVATLFALAIASCASLSCGGKSETDGRGGSSSGNGGTGSSGGSGSGGVTGGTGGTGATGGVGNPCALPPDPGPCKGLVRRWFFDSVIHKCTPFSYGGCEGNANNFTSATECVNECAPGVTNACDAMACPTNTVCAYAGGNAVCATPCGDDQSCATGTCGCGSSCPACEDCFPICVGG